MAFLSAYSLDILYASGLTVGGDNTASPSEFPLETGTVGVGSIVGTTGVGWGTTVGSMWAVPSYKIL